jgi:hypothetical protein
VAGRIRITSGDAAGRVVEIDGEVAFGRKGDGPGKLPGDIEISRLHARVYFDPDGWLMVEDAGSTNGTFVHGMRITAPTPLSPGDALRMGTTTLEVEAPPAAEPEPEEEPASPEPEEPDPEEPEPEPDPGRLAAMPPPVPAEIAEPEPEPSAPAPAAAPPSGTGVPRPLVWVLILVFALAAAGIAAVVILTGDDDEEKAPSGRAQGPPALVKAATEAGCTARDLPPEGNRVVTGAVTYRSDPPHSGDHAEKPASDGIWETAPPLPKIVSSLEQGRVVMWHKPGDEKGQRLLREVGDQSPRHMLLVPDATMPHRVAATAWGHLLGCPRINGSTPVAMRAFRDAYRDRGPRFEP